MLNEKNKKGIFAREGGRLTHGSLFSGIQVGGFDLAAEWMGWENLFHCEINEWCQKVLKYHFPNSIQYDDITRTDFTPWRGKVDVLTGGFPCQPFSTAGKRKGADDDRYLWPEMLRAIREIRPTWVIGENVAGILSMVQPGSEVTVESQASLFDKADKETILEQEYVIETVCRDLEREGYTVQPILIPACGVGAPHRRDRVWFIARRLQEDATDTYGEKLQTWLKNNGREIEEENIARLDNGVERSCCIRAFAESDKKRRCLMQYTSNDWPALSAKRWKDFPTQPPVCRRYDGLPFDVDYLAIPFTKWRQESIKAYGNAIVPQVAFEIFKAIETSTFHHS